MNKQNYFLTAAGIFYLIGFVNGSRSMQVLAAAAVAVILACFFLTRLLVRGLELRVKPLSHYVAFNQSTPLHVEVINHGRITRTGVTIEIHIRSHQYQLETETLHYRLPALPARSTSEFTVDVPCLMRGVHDLEKLRLVISDPLGIYNRAASNVKLDGFTGLPQIWETPATAPRSMITRATRPARIHLRGDENLRGIRPHRPGDDLRLMHWKASAHTGTLIVRDMDPGIQNSMHIWLDLSHSEAWLNDTQTEEYDYDEPWYAIYPQLKEILLGNYKKKLIEKPFPPGAPREVDESLELRISLAASLVQAFATHKIGFTLSSAEFTQSFTSQENSRQSLHRAILMLADTSPVAKIIHSNELQTLRVIKGQGLLAIVDAMNKRVLNQFKELGREQKITVVIVMPVFLNNDYDVVRQDIEKIFTSTNVTLIWVNSQYDAEVIFRQLFEKTLEDQQRHTPIRPHRRVGF